MNNHILYILSMYFYQSVYLALILYNYGMKSVSYYLLGIKGAAMANIAVMLKKQGHHVTGADVAEVFPTDIALTKNDITFDTFPVKELPPDIDVLVYSAAHGGRSHELARQAIAAGKQVVHQAELLGELMTHYENSIAVAGCHGKTTTSSLLTYGLIQLGQQPSYMVGTPTFSEYPGSDIAGKKYFVIEADEYGLNPPENKNPKFHYLKPDYAIITNVDFDHPDIFANLEETKSAFQTFMKNILEKNSKQPLVLCADDEPLMDIAKSLQRSDYVTYGTSASADYQIVGLQFNITATSFSLVHLDNPIGTFSTLLAGEKNAVNTAGVIVMLLKLGFDSHDIQVALANFSGAKRRFELVGEKNGIKIYDDYAHHPHELDAIIGATRSRFPGNRVIVLFQPHTFSRTAMLKEAFVQALARADVSILLPIFASAREDSRAHDISSASIAQLASEQGHMNIHSSRDTGEAIQHLRKTIRSGDIVLMAGAGDVYKLKDDILSVC